MLLLGSPACLYYWSVTDMHPSTVKGSKGWCSMKPPIRKASEAVGTSSYAGAGTTCSGAACVYIGNLKLDSELVRCLPCFVPGGSAGISNDMLATKEGNFVRRLLYLVTLSLVATLVFVPAAFAQELPRDQYGCVPQQTYVPEAGGCVAIEGLPPGFDPVVVDPDTGKSLGFLSSFTAPPATTTSTTPLPATGGPALLPLAGLLLLASGLIGLGVVRFRS